MAFLQSDLKSNTATSEDWLERTKDMSISSLDESGDFVALPVNDQGDFIRADFDKDLRKVSRKIKK